MRLLTLIAITITLTSCNRLEKKTITKTKPKLTQPRNSNFIEGPCAVIIRPDGEKIELLKKKSSEDEYATVVDDNEYYLGTSIEFLDSVKLKRIEKSSTGVLTFKSSLGQTFNLPLDSLYWGIILFNGRSKPIEADVTDINTDYHSYMKR